MVALSLVFWGTCSTNLRAEPWAAPGDTRLRHELQLLYDRGLLSGPSLSWPVSWPDIAVDLARVQTRDLAPALAQVVERLRARVARERRTDDPELNVSLAGGSEPGELRTFAAGPREELEASVGVSWLGERFAWKLQATVVTDPEDGQDLRPDGSYVGMSLGNWMLSAGYLDRWWGPGWDGSLLLGNNARPVPAVSIERADSRAMNVPVLNLLGPWRFITFMGQLEGDRDYDHPLLFGMRIEIRPLPSLQLAASRSAQWCGEGRPCDLDTFWDLIIGNDNDQDLEEQPGNQLAGFDARWTWPGGAVPLAVYAQAIGEDEAGFLPSKYLGLFGAEVWGEIAGGTWRAHLEYADTACDFMNSEPQFGCAYTNVIYTDGYRFRGRVLGHSIDADGQSLGFGALYVEPSGNLWRLLLRDVTLNRAGVAPGHSLADGPVEVTDVELKHERSYSWGVLEASLGYAQTNPAAGVSTRVDDGVRGYLSIRHEWR